MIEWTSVVLALIATTQEAAAAPTTEVAVWPQWRGPERDGMVQGDPWPSSLDDEVFEPVWRVGGLGPSYAGPIVGPKRVFTVETLDESHEVVRALDRRTGEELWTADWEGAMRVPFFAAKNGSWVRSTPAFDGKSLFVAGMRDVLVSLDAESGETRWSVDFAKRHGTDLPSFGFVCSPLVVGDALFVQAGAALLKLDKSTGETVWRAMEDRGGMDSAFSSPVVAELHGKQQLLVQTRTDLAGVSLEDGDVLWSTPIKSFRGMNILTPQPYGDAVFTATYGGRAQRLDVSQSQDAFAVESAWNNRAQGNMTSPLLFGDHAYLFLRSNRFTCIDLRSGKSQWTSPPPRDDYWSLAGNGDQILALSNNGMLRLIRATPEKYDVLSERQLESTDTWAHIAVAGDRVFVRSIDSLVAYSWK